jgi:hypothetical protein
MSAGLQRGILSAEQVNHFAAEGYLIVRGLLKPEEIQLLLGEFKEMHAGRSECFETPPISAEEANGEPLKMYPRMLYPHRVNETARQFMLNPTLLAMLADLFEEEPLAAQSMVYFKPPGARGQALHQDNYYLRVEPGTCIAAWIAIDPADRENGGLVVVPQTQHLDMECPHEADQEQSYFRDEVTVPEGKVIVPVNLDSGDVLFFNGSVIHGSYPNRSVDRFRRSFICHYVGESTARIGHHISEDLYNHKGENVFRSKNDNAGPCGTAFEGRPH